MVSCRQCRRDQLRSLLAILRGEHLGNQYAQFEINKARTRRLTHPGDFLLKGFGSRVHQILPLAVGANSGDKPDNVSLSSCDGEQALASAANVKRRGRGLHPPGGGPSNRDGVVMTCRNYQPIPEQTPYKLGW